MRLILQSLAVLFIFLFLSVFVSTKDVIGEGNLGGSGGCTENCSPTQILNGGNGVNSFVGQNYSVTVHTASEGTQTGLYFVGYYQNANSTYTAVGTGGGGGFTCFPKGTKVTLANGIKKNIEDIKVGEMVVGDGKIISRVAGLQTPMSDNLCQINLDSGNVLKLTRNHSVYAMSGSRLRQGSGEAQWAAISPDLALKENPSLTILPLVVGDKVMRESGQWDQITSISCQSLAVQTYNLMLGDGSHTYYADGILVHNKGGQCRGCCSNTNCGQCGNPPCCNANLWGSCGGTLANCTQQNNCGTVRSCAPVMCNVPPVIDSVTISNIGGTLLTADAYGRNQICEDLIRNSAASRTVRFTVNATDANGGMDVGTSSGGMTLIWNGRGITIPQSTFKINGNNVSGTAVVLFSSADNTKTTVDLGNTVTYSNYASYQTDANTVSFWHLDSALGTNLTDSSNSTNTATGFGAGISVGVSGIINNGRTFVYDNSNYLEASKSNVGDFAAGQDFTVEAWVNSAVGQYSSYQPSIVSKWNNDATNGWPGWGLYLEDATQYGPPYPYFEVYHNNEAYWAEADTVINDGRWHHLVGVRTASNIYLYIDGVQAAVTAAPSIDVSVPSNPIQIGDDQGAETTSYFEGKIDEVRISNVARSAAEIKQAFNYGNVLNIALNENDVTAIVYDQWGTNDTNSSRNFKVWDCQIPVTGTMFDSSDVLLGAVCSTGVGFRNPAPASMNFQSVGVSLVSPFGSTMLSTSSVNTYGPFTLTWGGTFKIQPNPDIAANNLVTRWINVGGIGTTYCGPQQNLATIVDPYDDTPGLQVDFSAIRFQDPWFQVVGGGVQAKGSLANMVPLTCVANSAICTPAMSVASAVGASDNGLISGNPVTNSSGCSIDGASPLCFYSKPSNWGVNASILNSNDQYGYQTAYSSVVQSLGIGLTLNGGTKMSDLGAGATGVYLVNGDFTVDINNVVPVGSYLMIIAKGTITIASTVTSTAGVFVGDLGVITAAATTDNALTINGSLYSGFGNVRLNRGFLTIINNNTKPAVTIKYRSDFIFSLPGNLFKIVRGFRQL